MNIITIAAIAIAALLLIGELITIVFLCSIYKEYKDIKNVNEILINFIQENNHITANHSKTIMKMFDCEETMIKLVDAISDQYKIMMDDYKSISDGYSRMVNVYRETGENYKTILNAWVQCEQRYSDSFDQFKLCSDELKELNGKLDELTFNGQNLSIDYDEIMNSERKQVQ